MAARAGNKKKARRPTNRWTGCCHSTLGRPKPRPASRASTGQRHVLSMKMRIYTAVLILVAATAFRCVGQTNATDLVGTWVSVELYDRSQVEKVGTLIYDFRTNGTFSIARSSTNFPTNTFSGIYSINSNQVTMNIPSQGSRVFLVSTNGGHLTLTDAINRNWVRCKRKTEPTGARDGVPAAHDP